MKLKCHNPECGHEWEYKGNSKFYASCPVCHYKVRIRGKKGEKKAKEPLVTYYEGRRDAFKAILPSLKKEK